MSRAEENKPPPCTSKASFTISEPLYSFEYRKLRLGYMFRIEPRFYFDGEAPEENYLGLQYNSARYNFTIPKVVNGYQNGALQDEYETLNDFMVHFGHQTLYDHLTMDWSVAPGLRQIKGQKYVANGTGIDGFSNYSKSTVNFGMGFSIGYRF